MDRLLEFNGDRYDSRLYQHNSSSIVATEKMMMKNTSESRIQKKYLGSQHIKNGMIFNIETLSETFGNESAIKKISKDMNSIVRNIDVITDEQCKIRSIYNMIDVIDRWSGVRKKWLKEASKDNRANIQRAIETVETNLKNGSFKDDITNQGALYFLLNGLYGSYNEKEDKVVHRNLNKFLVTQSLPLIIHYKVKEYNRYTKEMTIEGVGMVDEERLDKKQLTSFIRKLKDKINLKVDLQVAYQERLEFDGSHWLKNAEQEVKIKIPGFYMTESQQKIKQIKPNE